MNNAWAHKHLKPVAGYGACLPLLLDKTIDAVTTDDSVLAGFANDPRYKGQVRLLGKRFTDHIEKYGIGITKADPADITLINTTLKQMISDGRWENAVRKNLGDYAPLFLKPENRPAPATP
jgi:glutamate transport system substrate-binding protein